MNTFEHGGKKPAFILFFFGVTNAGVALSSVGQALDSPLCARHREAVGITCSLDGHQDGMRAPVA